MFTRPLVPLSLALEKPKLVLGRLVRPDAVEVHAETPADLRDQLLEHFNRTGDKTITKDDFRRRKANKVVIHNPTSGDTTRLKGPEQISRAAAIAAELARQGHQVFDVKELTPPRSQALADEFTSNWAKLERRSDNVSSIMEAMRAEARFTPKDGEPYRVYASTKDPEAAGRLADEAEEYNEAHKDVHVEVHALDFSDPAVWQELNEHVGMAYLPKSYVVPGGRFNEMFNWDSAFIALELLRTGTPENMALARNMAENFCYDLEHYGKIPNSNSSFLMSRTQPPLLATLALALDKAVPDPAFLARCTAAADFELKHVWMSGNRASPSGNGLSRYYDDASGPLSELEAGSYKFFPNDPEFYAHERSIRESGHDDTHQYGLEAHHYEPVELNSLLYRYETDLAQLYARLEGEKSPNVERLTKAADTRRTTMQARFWDEAKQSFFDYNFAKNERSSYWALSAFFAMRDGWATPEQAAALVKHLDRFIEKGGLATSSRASRDAAGGESFQWDHPVGWGPLQQVVIEGLVRYGDLGQAQMLAYRWLSMVLGIAGLHNGLVKEKYDVVHASPKVTVEYGNQGGDRGALDADEAEPMGFGWTNSSYLKLLSILSPELRAALDANVKPDKLFGKAPAALGPIREARSRVREGLRSAVERARGS